MNKWKLLPAALIAVALLLMHSYNVSTGFRQSTVWTGPYLSAAANLSWPVEFRIDTEEIKQFNYLDDTRREDAYRFKPSANLTTYAYNDLGYVYLVWAARHLFPFLGDQQAIILLQALVHLLLCSILLTSQTRFRPWRLGFFLLYAVNPLVIKYVVFNHYYFWQSIPALFILFLTRRPTERIFLYGFIAILPWAVLARVTTILVLPVILYLMYRRASRLSLVVAVGYFALVWGFFFKPSPKNVWHTAYVGTGAYQNPYGINLNDEDGFLLYQKAYGIKLSGATGGNAYEPGPYRRYRDLSREVFLNQLSESPGLYFKNAVVNTLGAFGPGYLSGRPDWVNYLLSLLGLAAVAFLLWHRQWVFVLGIGLLSGSFTLYYPPIPAYTYGNYALLVGGLLAAFSKFRHREHPAILYLSFNDGSDMRINKEVGTLCRVAHVELIALGDDPLKCYAAAAAGSLHFVQGGRKSPGTLIRYFVRGAYLLVTRRYVSVHIINEPQLLILWPFLWLQKNVVLDIFDSMFLRKNYPGNKLAWLKRVVYAPIDRCIVTDENRRQLLPDFMKDKACIVPNYPHELRKLPPKERSAGLTIMYYGWLGEQRGTLTARNLLAADPTLQVIMAGWLADEPSRLLTQHPRVTWLGTLPQAEAADLVARRADYILCVYAPTNDNNINASPNKIYDAIQTRTPVIINAEVKVSEFVREKGIGYVMPRYGTENYEPMAATLLQRYKSYRFDDALRHSYTWEKAEGTLLAAHELRNL